MKNPRYSFVGTSVASFLKRLKAIFFHLIGKILSLFVVKRTPQTQVLSGGLRWQDRFLGEIRTRKLSPI
jgi:hypothetical protein